MYFIAFCALMLTALAGSAAEPERYHAITIPESGESQGSGLSAKVFILDTQQGHMWTWSENEPIYDGGDTPKLGTVLIYQGQLRPGTKMGEIVAKFLR